MNIKIQYNNIAIISTVLLYIRGLKNNVRKSEISKPAAICVLRDF